MPKHERPEISGVVRLLWWLNAGYCAFWHRFEIPPRDPLPGTGAIILISNHTSNIDHMLLQATTRRALGFVIAREFYDNPLFHPFCKLIGCIPVNRDGKDLAAFRAALRALGEGRVVPVFPEGRILATSGRELGEGKPGVAFIALRARVPVLPAFIWGTPETNQVWRALRTPSHARVVFGPPVELSDLTEGGKAEREQIEAATHRLMVAIRQLKDQVRGTECLAGGAPGASFVSGGGDVGDGDHDDTQPERRPGALPGRASPTVRS